MQAQLTEFLLRVTFEGSARTVDISNGNGSRPSQQHHTSAEILAHIHETLNSQKNYKLPRNHKLSLSSEDTNPQSPIKCNCKKSKCLKLYCECFSKGSFCKDCNCENCHNTQEYAEVRAKAIDQMMVKTSMSFGYKTTSSGKGCNCKKTGCRKKYCECYSQGIPCNEFCKCNNCQNHS